MPWFEPPGVSWTYASRRLIPARLIAGLITLALFGTGVVALFWGVGWPVGLAFAFVVVLMAWTAWVIVRQVTAHAWAEQKDDLVVKRGRMFRRVTVVPYGRMQYVEVSAGPIDRSLGIARVKLHTASPGTDAHLSGVPAAEAARLRDRLTERGEARLAGL